MLPLPIFQRNNSQDEVGRAKQLPLQLCPVVNNAEPANAPV